MKHVIKCSLLSLNYIGNINFTLLERLLIKSLGVHFRTSQTFGGISINVYLDWWVGASMWVAFLMYCAAAVRERVNTYKTPLRLLAI